MAGAARLLPSFLLTFLPSSRYSASLRRCVRFNPFFDKFIKSFLAS